MSVENRLPYPPLMEGKESPTLPSNLNQEKIETPCPYQAALQYKQQAQQNKLSHPVSRSNLILVAEAARFRLRRQTAVDTSLAQGQTSPSTLLAPQQPPLLAASNMTTTLKVPQGKDLNSSIPGDLQALLNVLLDCDQYILLSQINKKLQAWKNHDALVLALAKHYKLSADSLSSDDLPPGMRTALVYKYIAQLTQHIQWEHELAPNPNNPNEIGHNGWTVSNADGRSLLEVRIALLSRIQTILEQNNLGKVPGLAGEVCAWITQDPTLLEGASPSIRYESLEWMTLWRGTDALIEDGRDPAQFSIDERLIIGRSVFSGAMEDALTTEVKTPAPPQPNGAAPASAQEPLPTYSPSTPPLAQKSLNETCTPRISNQNHPQTPLTPAVKGDILSLLLMAQASNYIDLRTLDPCDEQVINKLIAYAHLVRRFPKEPQLIKKIMALNSLELPTRSDIAQEIWHTLGINPSPDMMQRYLQEDNLNWYVDPTPSTPSTLPADAMQSAPHKLSQAEQHKLKTQSLVEAFNKKFDQAVQALSAQAAEVINEISIVQYCQDHQINLDDAAITVSTVQKEVLSLDKAAVVEGELGMVMVNREVPKEEILESRGYFVAIKTPATDHTPAAEHRFFVRQGNLEEIPLPQNTPIREWCQAHDELVFGTGHKQNFSEKTVATYLVDNLASGKQQDIQSQIKDAYLQKLNLVRQTAYQPSMKEILKEALLDGLIPWRATIRAISNGETPAHIAQKAAIDTLQFLPTLFVGAGAGLHAGETMTKVMLSEFAALSEKGIVDVLKRSSARIARHHATELLGSAAEVAKTAVQDTFWLPLGMWHTLRAGETLIAGKISHTPLAQKLSAAAAATEHTAIAQTWRLSDSATTSAEKSYVKATDPAGDSQLLQRMGPNQFATLNPQNLVPQRPLFVSTPQGELTTTFLPVLQNCRLTEDKDALILKQIATQQENKSHLFQVGFRFYAQLETTEKNYVYVEVRPYRTSRGATDWRLYDPKISHPGLLPSIVWNEIAGKWQPLERLRLRGGGNTLKKQAIETRSHGNDADFSDMKKVNIDGETYFVANEADADDGTHYRLYVPDPSNPLTLVCSRIAKFDHTEGWKTIEVGSNGLGNSRNIKIPHPANNAGSDISAYEIPTDMKKYILDADSRTLSGLYMNTNAEPEEEIAISLWRQKREQLFQDAKNFFKDNHPLPSRPLIPVLKQNAKSNEIIEEIYKRANGMIIGESHNSIASKKFLIDNMENYQKNGVETLYMEHLQSDIHQADLDKYYQSGEMPNNLKTFLETQDRQHHTDRKKRYTFIEIVKAAYKNKIRIVAIDCSESYIIRELQDTHSKGTNNIRIKIFNYYSTKTINHDQAKKSSKWVALVGNTHTNTYNGIPGVAELNAAIGVQICDVEGPPMKVLVDPEVNIHYDPYFHPHSLDTHANEVTIVKPDLKIEMSTRLSASNRHRSLRNYDFSSISEDMKKIHKKAFFIYKNPTSDEYELLYKLSADEPVKKLVIKKTSVKNQIYIEDCPDIEAINNKKFKNISTLVDVLQRNGITWAEK